jgi:hypothetical protein
VDAVALAATIGGSLVGLAGVGATMWSVRQQRESAKELAASQQAHERLLASGERLFEKRAAVYEGMVGVVQSWAEKVEDTEPILRLADDAAAPEQPTVDEQRALNTVLRTFGSEAVAKTFSDFVVTVREFFFEASSLRTLREQGAPALPWEQLQEKRAKVRSDLAALERLVSDELAAL